MRAGALRSGSRLREIAADGGRAARIRAVRLPLTKSSSTLAFRWKTPVRNRGNKHRPLPITPSIPNQGSHGESAMSDHDHNHNDDERGPSRRRVLECMTWAGTGVLWTITGGVPHS